ncbi:MAG: ABC transporter substrate-binding protein [Spirochaetaceae bacterium]|nr:ABC transporter substrate-binding protein [Spirochaetaceae bacterium]
MPHANRRPRPGLASALVLALGLASILPLSAQTPPPAKVPAQGAAAAQTPARATIRHATGFTVAYREGYKLVSVSKPWPGATERFEYVLYPRGKPRPAYAGKAVFMETPLRRVVSYSSTYLPQILAAGGLESLVGLDNAAYVSSPEVRARVASGKAVETSRNFAPNVELLISLAPDAIFTYGVGNEWDSHPKLAEAGLPVVLDGEWNESDPLARAEWMKFIALFYDAEAAAEARFAAVERDYLRLKALAAGGSGARPKVLVNAPFQGLWTVAGGKSYQARFIADSGGDYLWAEDGRTGGIPLSVEAAYARGLSAELWLNPGAADSLAALAASDARIADLPVLKKGAVYSPTLRVNEAGANDYYESGVMRPDLVLADLVRILRPELKLGGELHYYKRLR